MEVTSNWAFWPISFAYWNCNCYRDLLQFPTMATSSLALSSLSSPPPHLAAANVTGNSLSKVILQYRKHSTAISSLSTVQQSIIHHDHRHGFSTSSSQKWRARVSFFPAFLNKKKDVNAIKEELLEAIEPLDRGAEATTEDQKRVDEVCMYLSSFFV